MAKMTENGVSTTKKLGTENYEQFKIRKQSFVQYDYRHTDGRLFSCVCETVHHCRIKKNRWLELPVVQEKEQDKRQLINDLLVTAFEGGSNYWYFINTSHQGHPADYITQKDGILEITDLESESNDVLGMLTYDRCLKGMELLKQDYIDHYNDAINEEYDATTADVFLQLAVMGDVIFG